MKYEYAREELRMTAEDVVFEAGLIPTRGDMEMMLGQDGVVLSRPAGEFLSEIARLPQIGEEENARLAHRLAAGDESVKGELIEGNMRLAVCAARRYDGRGLPFADLLQEASLGLVLAVESYTEECGGFPVFAAYTILSALDEAAAGAEDARKIPEHLTELLQTISRSDMVLEERLGREATPEEIAADTGLALDEVTAVMEIMEDIASRDNGEEDGAEDADGEKAGHSCECGDPDCTGHHHYDPGHHTHS